MNQGLAVQEPTVYGHDEASRADASVSTSRARAPNERFDLVVLGAGQLAKTAALEAGRLGARVAWFVSGSESVAAELAMKSWIASARAAQRARDAAELGLHAAGIRVDFSELAARTARLVAELDRHDDGSPRSLGMEIVNSPASFCGDRAVAASGLTYEFRRAIVVTNTQPAAPRFAGLADVGCVNRLSARTLTALPARWVILGGDAVGCEWAQALRRFGCEVHLAMAAESLLPTEEPYAAEVVRRQLEREGVNLHLGWTPTSTERLGGAKGVTIERNGERVKIFADEILAATAELPNLEHLGLDRAAINFDERGIAIDDLLRTSNPAVYALGSGCRSRAGEFHSAVHARNLVRNALLMGRYRAERWKAPRVIDTSPAVARLGLTRAEAAAAGLAVESFRLELAEIASAALVGETEGFAVIHVARGGEEIVGATIVAEQANELIGTLALAMNRRGGLRALANSSSGELLSRLAERALPRRLTPRLAGWLRRWFAWRRGAVAESSAVS